MEIKKVAALAVIALFSAGVLLPLGGSAVARNDCYAWAQARSIIASEKLLPARNVTKSVTKKYGGSLIGAKLCERRGQFVYDVTILGTGGQVTQVTVNSRSGRHLSVKGSMNAGAAGGAPKLKKKGGFGFGFPKFWKKK